MANLDSTLQRFWARVRKGDGCWIFSGGNRGKGYKHLCSGGKARVAAHRFSWELAHGQKIPDGMLVCHTCDVRACVRPDHLFLGTHKDNHRDMMQKGRDTYAIRRQRTMQRPTCKRGHPWALGKWRINSSNGYRQCNICFYEQRKRKQVA
jgi:hypothetical protein